MWIVWPKLNTNHFHDASQSLYLWKWKCLHINKSKCFLSQLMLYSSIPDFHEFEINCWIKDDRSEWINIGLYRYNLKQIDCRYSSNENEMSPMIKETSHKGNITYCLVQQECSPLKFLLRVGMFVWVLANVLWFTFLRIPWVARFETNWHTNTACFGHAVKQSNDLDPLR